MITRLNRYRHLLEERTRTSWVMDHAADGYLTLHADGTIALANPPARRLLGLADNAPLPAGPLLPLLSRGFSCEPAAAWAGWPAPAPEGLPRYLVRQTGADRQPTWIQVEALAQGGEQDHRILVRLRDISAQMGTQREMWTFHAMVSHKLRTPLISLYGLEIIKRGAATMPTETLTSLADAALRGAKRLHAAVEDVLASTRAPALAHGDACCAAVDLPTLLSEAAGAAGVADVELRLEAQLSAASLALSRPAVQAVLQELLENARKFHPTQSPRVEVVAASGPGGAAHLTVCDDGRHLAPEQLARLGVPYMQIEASFTGEVPGMGLGTAMVGAVLWEIGGAVRFSNRAGRPGLSVELEIPLAKSVAAGAG
jgi:signal transduction histidine kinase